MISRRHGLSRDADVRVSADLHLGMDSLPFPMIPGPPRTPPGTLFKLLGPHGSLNERVSTMVKHTGCSSVGPGFILSTHAAIPGDPAPSPGLFGYQMQMWNTERHAARTHMHMK